MWAACGSGFGAGGGGARPSWGLARRAPGKRPRGRGSDRGGVAAGVAPVVRLSGDPGTRHQPLAGPAERERHPRDRLPDDHRGGPMKLYIASTSSFAGKTLLALALGRIWKEAGVQVG